MSDTKFLTLVLTAATIAGCANCGGAGPTPETAPGPEPVPADTVPATTYDVHEWGLVRHVSGPNESLP